VSKLEILVLPITLEHEGCLVHLLEILKHSGSSALGIPPYFTAVVSIECGDIKTKPFSIDARSNEELIAKIETEITKIKYTEMLYGSEFVKRLVAR